MVDVLEAMHLNQRGDILRDCEKQKIVWSTVECLDKSLLSLGELKKGDCLFHSLRRAVFSNRRSHSLSTLLAAKFNFKRIVHHRCCFHAARRAF